MTADDALDRPVRDLHGHVLWRVRVAPDERTCTACGETIAPGDICARCGYGEDGQLRGSPPPAVPSTSYLRPHEFDLVR